MSILPKVQNERQFVRNRTKLQTNEKSFLQKIFQSRIIALSLLSILMLSSLAFAKDIEVYFSPNGGCEQKLITEINSAKKEVKIAIYSFTNKEIADAVIAKAKSGVLVSIYMDRTQSKGKNNLDEYLIANGVSVQVKEKTATMHDKFVVIDNSSVATGSYNWTENAEENNDENLIIIHNRADIATQYSAQFEKMKSED